MIVRSREHCRNNKKKNVVDDLRLLAMKLDKHLSRPGQWCRGGRWHAAGRFSFEFSNISRAGQNRVAGRTWPAGRLLHVVGLVGRFCADDSFLQAFP